MHDHEDSWGIRSHHAWIRPASCRQTVRPSPGSPAPLCTPGQGYIPTVAVAAPAPERKQHTALTHTD